MDKGRTAEKEDLTCRKMVNWRWRWRWRWKGRRCAEKAERRNATLHLFFLSSFLLLSFKTARTTTIPPTKKPPIERFKLNRVSPEYHSWALGNLPHKTLKNLSMYLRRGSAKTYPQHYTENSRDPSLHGEREVHGFNLFVLTNILH